MNDSYYLALELTTFLSAKFLALFFLWRQSFKKAHFLLRRGVCNFDARA